MPTQTVTPAPGGAGPDPVQMVLATLTAALQTLNDAQDLQVILQTGVEQARLALDMAAAAVYVREAKGAGLTLAAQQGWPDPLCSPACDPLPENYLETLFPDRRLSATLTDLRACANAPAWAHDPALRTWLATPLRARGEDVGLLCAAAWDDRPPRPGDELLLAAIGWQLAAAVACGREIAQKEVALRERNSRWSALYDIAVLLTRSLDSRHLLEEIVRRSVELLGAQSGILTIENPATGQFAIAVAYHPDGKLAPLIGRQIQPNEGVVGYVLATGQPVVADDYHRWPGYLPAVAPLLAGPVVAVPLTDDQRVIGVLGLAADDPARHFSDDDVQTLTLLAQQAAAALARVRARTQADELGVRAEQTRLAHDLHDGLAQDLAALLLRLDACLDQVRPDQPELAATLEAVSQGLQHSIRDARATILALRALDLVGRNLPDALRSLIGRFEANSGLPVFFIDNTPAAWRLSLQHEVALLRFAQEALSNALRHAGAQRVSVKLTCPSPGEVMLAVGDDGAGFDPDSALAQSTADGHLGLELMGERAAALGGSVRVNSAPGQGTRIEMVLPRAR
ncbi:MAG: GAF domain-containing sensor histidine kinase [Chloroflexi bacterium]|nr:GAF domain-containing sensor histidine kinase [Chloroflexota bacterium]